MIQVKVNLENVNENGSSSQNWYVLFRLEELHQLIRNHKLNTGRMFCFDIIERNDLS